MTADDERFLALAQSRRHHPISPMDSARSYLFLRKMGLTISEICERLDEKRGKVYRHLRLLKLPVEVQKQVHEGRISMTEALRGKP